MQTTKMAIACAVRKKAVSYFKNPDLDETCAIVSFALKKSFKLSKFKADVFSGFFDGFCHCWLQSDDKIWDLTAAQFSCDYPEIIVTDLTDKRYLGGKKVSVKDFKYWISSQKPRPSVVKKIISGGKIK